jgi:hypothetical protein
MVQRYYTNRETGESWPLEEATEDYRFQAFKTDRRKSVIGHPTSCIIARGLKHDKNVVNAFLGGGKDAYIVFKGKGGKPDYAKHYTIPAKASRVRDTFDQRGSPETQWLVLSAPTAGRTLAARERLGKRRREEIKAGSPVKKRPNNNRPRIVRLGVPHRPRPVVKKGEWSIPMPEEANA